MQQQTNLRPSNPFNFPSWQESPLTLALIGISVVVAVLSKLGENDSVLDSLFISQYDLRSGEGFLPEVVHGQVWRLLTPIFIHFGWMHILFNMLWLKDLGAMVERVIGRGTLLALVVVIGILGNVGQFIYSGPYFGGMSGVVYGLLGYIWMKSRFHPASGLFVDQRTVVWMIGWFVLCVTGLVGNVANAAHAVGLIVGVAWGFTSAKTRSLPGLR